MSSRRSATTSSSAATRTDRTRAPTTAPMRTAGPVRLAAANALAGEEAAIVTDGWARDIEGIEAVGIPVFARGLTPNSPEKNGPGEIGLPVSVGGEVIEAGDAIVGDRDGVVAVSRTSCSALRDRGFDAQELRRLSQ